MNDPVLFVAADRREIGGWVSRWQNVRPVALAVNWARTGTWKGKAVAAIANGAGMDRAFTAVVMAGKVSAACSVGFCGALDESLSIGDVVVATEVRNGAHSYPAEDPGNKAGLTGTVASIDHVAQTAAEKRKLRATGASIVEMEAAGVAKAAQDLALPFFCIRAVSDLAREDLANDFNEALTADGQFSLARILTRAMASPRERLPELLRLRRRSAIAAKNLGEFLADCNF